jgi:choline dehydrogenase-like flavoprotein
VSRVVVVGSGPSGVHFALTLLRRGHEVVMLDVGREKPAAAAPDQDFEGLKERLDDPAAYFLGEGFEAVTLPGPDAGVYAFPPSKRYIFDGAPGFPLRGVDFASLSSLAQGGLAEAWTAGVYPFNDHELADYPFSHSEIAPCYDEVARRIGVNGAPDDLEAFIPIHEHLDEPLRLDRHSAALLGAYEQRRESMQRDLGCYMGRSRIATLTHDAGERRGCSYCGRCLFGCPTGSLYTPSMTLAECRRYPNFRYLQGVRVSHFSADESGRVTAVEGHAVQSGEPVQLPVEILALAAGTLSSSRIFLESLARRDGSAPRLTGLMDNRQVLVPYLYWRMIGAPYEPRSYQYHQVALGLAEDEPREYVHAQITALTTGLVHPIVQRLPFDLRTAVAVFRYVRSALGIANVNLHDTRRPESYLELEPGAEPGTRTLVARYLPDPAEEERIARALKRVGRALRRLGCIVPRGMTEVRPMGAGVHYAGTLPMSRERRPLTTAPSGRSHDFENLLLVDGSTFPFLPAKNITFTLMANAVRIADQAF